MPPFSTLTFNIADVPGDLTPGHPLWDRPLSGRSREFSGLEDPATGNWTIGDYFLAARTFILQPNILERIAAVLGPAAEGPDHWAISLALQKHGAFYHPIKMTLRAKNCPESRHFVLNGAVSEHGRELALKESRLFSLLAETRGLAVTPRVDAAGEVEGPLGRAGFLMAQWLDGYYEFHLTRERGPREIAVWRPERGTLYLSMDQALEVYRQIAEILTRAYDPDTGGQVLFWHHAAGDFILAPAKETLPVKLITVREYGSMVDEVILGQGPLPGLLFFFLNLCLRMQLDRLDGVGKPVLLGAAVLEATIRGFLTALAAGHREKIAPETVWTFFRKFDPDQIKMILEQMLDVWPMGPSEEQILQREIGGFAGQIGGFLKTRHFSDFY